MLWSKLLDKKLWAEAVNCCVYVLNRTRKIEVAEMTSIQLWDYQARKPNITHFKSFGSEVFSFILKLKRITWHKKAMLGILVGYDNNARACQIYMSTIGRVECYRDVVFREELSFSVQKRTEKKEYLPLKLFEDSHNVVIDN